MDFLNSMLNYFSKAKPINNNSIEYSSGLFLDVYKPNDNKKHPVVICLHGGKFESGDKKDPNLLNYIKTLVNNNYICVAPNYSLTKNQNIPLLSQLSAFQKASDDVANVFRWVIKNYTEYNFDISKIFVMGESAGAHIAIGLNVGKYDDIRPKGCISLWGGAIFTTYLFDKTDSPMMFVHGLKDKTIGASYLDTLAMSILCKNRFIPYELYLIPNSGHGCWSAKINGKTIGEVSVEFLNNH